METVIGSDNFDAARLRDVAKAKDQSLTCKAACPANYTKLAVEPRSCATGGAGEDAYCCQGFKPSDIPDIHKPPGHDSPSSPPKPKKSAKLVQFENAVDTYLNVWNTGKCDQESWPELDSWIDPEDDHGQSAPAGMATAQDTPPFSNSSDIQQGGLSGGPIIPSIEPCYQYINLVSELETMVTMDPEKFSKDQTGIRTYWDSRVATRFQGTSFSDLAEYQKINPLVEPRRWLRFLMYDFGAWVKMRNHVKQMRDEMCVEVPASGVYTSGTANVSRRYINADIAMDTAKKQWREPAFLIPTLGDVFAGIHDRYLSLHYARWQWYNGREGGRAPTRPGPMLELAYWIGPTPGVWNPQLDTIYQLWRYRDLRTIGRRDPFRRDRWVVFHLHFDSTHVFFNHSHHTYTAIDSITVFHGNEARPAAGGGWEVNWQGTSANYNTARTVIRCPYTVPEGSTWDTVQNRWRMMVGQNLETREAGWPYQYAANSQLYHFQHWLDTLYRTGYLNVAGFYPIIEPVYHITNYYGEIAAGVTTFVERSASAYPVPGSPPNIWVAPYDTSFRLQNFQQGVNSYNIPRVNYDYAIPMPAQLPQDHEG
ncbi:hypothetical protein NX059_011339 [Plenodomus lindquistii]|nr:hypothetical protein NX059_011339 [Plenodomus lindquistii]